LKKGLEQAFEGAVAKGAARKAVIFTESVKTQEYWWSGSRSTATRGRIAVIERHQHRPPAPRAIYDGWKKRHKANWAGCELGLAHRRT
jgi:hypothetical protein